MRNFRKFLTNNPVVIEFSAPGYVTNTAYSGPLKLPDLSLGNVYQKPGETPAGGFKDVGQFAQSRIDISRYGNVERYQQIKALHKLGVMANYIVIVGQQKDPAQESFTRRYKLSKLTPDGKYITGLPMQGMFSDGGYPELRHEDLDIGEKLGVIVDDPYPPSRAILQSHGLDPNAKMYAIDVERLRAMMIQTEQEMHARERQYKAWQHLGGKADSVLGLMNQGGQLSYSKSVNPLGGN